MFNQILILTWIFKKNYLPFIFSLQATGGNKDIWEESLAFN